MNTKIDKSRKIGFPEDTIYYKCETKIYSNENGKVQKSNASFHIKKTFIDHTKLGSLWKLEIELEKIEKEQYSFEVNIIAILKEIIFQIKATGDVINIVNREILDQIWDDHKINFAKNAELNNQERLKLERFNLVIKNDHLFLNFLKDYEFVRLLFPEISTTKLDDKKPIVKSNKTAKFFNNTEIPLSSIALLDTKVAKSKGITFFEIETIDHIEFNDSLFMELTKEMKNITDSEIEFKIFRTYTLDTENIIQQSKSIQTIRLENLYSYEELTTIETINQNG